MRQVAIHAHLYQPPRENPWTGEVERQPDAGPFHDWNERITFECYRPNAEARLLDDRGRPRAVRNAFSGLSFDVGPTLAGWLARHAPDVLAAMRAGDGEAAARVGAGGAMALPYAHPILPLCTTREKRLQVSWGLRDFEHRFGRKAEGMWLPETAVDVETLEQLARAGVRFTILAPRQAARLRPVDGGPWTNDPKDDPRLYQGTRHELRGGRSIDLLFYDGAVSHAVAFEGLLRSGSDYADRLRARTEDPGQPRLTLAATDGESYGHHHRFGDMALAHAMEILEADPETRLTTPAAFLAAHLPRWVVEIEPDTSWSCSHGIERWRADCGCRFEPASAGSPAQSWRAPLRGGLERLRDRLDELYQTTGREVFEDPEEAADDYGRVVAGGATRHDFLARHLKAEGAGAATTALALLEMQRHALLMFASCAWFFDDLDRVEPVQGLRHAARAIDLASDLGATGLEDDLLRALQNAPGPSRAHPDGVAIWRTKVRPAAGDREAARS